MTHLAAMIFFTLMLLAATVAVHMTVRLYWSKILLALRGELGREVSPPAQLTRAYQPRRRAAF